MSKLDAAIEKHMNYIVFREHRPFSYRDFQTLEVDGKNKNMANGTFRNKISQLIKAGKVEREYISNLAFYTIKSVNFGRRKHNSARMMMTQPMTPNHMGVSSVTAVTDSSNAIINSTPNPPSICNIIQELPPNNNSVHDIHFKFHVQDIWTIISSSSSYLQSKLRLFYKAPS
jgi:hypothetical protein